MRLSFTQTDWRTATTEQTGNRASQRSRGRGYGFVTALGLTLALFGALLPVKSFAQKPSAPANRDAIIAQNRLSCTPFEALKGERPDIAATFAQVETTVTGSALVDALKEKNQLVCTLPPDKLTSAAAAYVSGLDFLLFTPGEDIHFVYFHESLHAAQVGAFNKIAALTSGQTNPIAAIQEHFIMEAGAYSMQTVDAYQRYLKGDKNDFEKITKEHPADDISRQFAELFLEQLKKNPNVEKLLKNGRSLPPAAFMDAFASEAINRGFLAPYEESILETLVKQNALTSESVLAPQTLSHDAFSALLFGSLFKKDAPFSLTANAVAAVGKRLAALGLDGLKEKGKTTIVVLKGKPPQAEPPQATRTASKGPAPGAG